MEEFKKLNPCQSKWLDKIVKEGEKYNSDEKPIHMVDMIPCTMKDAMDDLKSVYEQCRQSSVSQFYENLVNEFKTSPKNARVLPILEAISQSRTAPVEHQPTVPKVTIDMEDVDTTDGKNNFVEALCSKKCTIRHRHAWGCAHCGLYKYVGLQQLYNATITANLEEDEDATTGKINDDESVGGEGSPV